MRIALVMWGLVSVVAAAQPAPTFKAWTKQLGDPVRAPQGPAGGTYATHVDFSSPRGLTPQERKRWSEQLTGVADWVLKAPVFAQPAGISPGMAGFGAVAESPPWVDKRSTAPLVGALRANVWPPAADVKKPPFGEAGLRLEFNYVYLPTRASWMEDGAGEFGLLAIEGEYAGFPIVNESLLLTRDGKLPFRPVSQERVLKAFVAYTRGEVARVEKALAGPKPPDVSGGGYGTYRTALALRKRLETASREELQQPAWVDPDAGKLYNELTLLPAGQGTQVVEVDPDFFDPKQRAALRCAWVRDLRRLRDDARNDSDGQMAVVARASLTLFQQLDWRDFAQRFLQPR